MEGFVTCFLLEKKAETRSEYVVREGDWDLRQGEGSDICRNPLITHPDKKQLWKAWRIEAIFEYI
jgi:hypothetical protein